MSENPTTLEEIQSFRFLRDRVTALTTALLNAPDQTVLWIGAGLSAKYGGLPTWTQFLRKLLEQYVTPATRDFSLIQDLLDSGRLAIAAECLQDIIGTKFLPILVEEFGKLTKRLPDHLAYLGVRDVITTNYDILLETALPWYEPISPSSGIERLLSSDFKIVKIHGSIAQPQSCVLSLSSYVRAYNINLHWYLTNVFSSCHVVFLGSSMNPAEPYFRVLRLLKSNSRAHMRHFAVVAVNDSKTGTREGKRLQEFGIELVPYIPDEEHSFLDQLFAHIDSQRGSSETIQLRLKAIRDHLAAGRLFHAALHLWHASHADVSRPSDRCALGDTVSEFFNHTLGVGSTDTKSFTKRCEDAGLDFSQLWLRTADLLIPSAKSVHGLRQSLGYVEAATGRRFPLLSRRLAELERQIIKPTRAG